MMRLGILLLAGCVSIFLLSGCNDESHGQSVPSSDGGTYLVVDDNNGGNCGPILVDGREWLQPLHTPGSIAPGAHSIECGGAIEFEIEPGTTFYFDNWGP